MKRAAMETTDDDDAPRPAKGVKRRLFDTAQHPKPSSANTPWSWSTDDVGYFYPDYKAEMDHLKANESGPSHATVFHNAEAFVSHLRGLLVFKRAEIIRSNIHLCLRNDALDWYNSELSDAERNNLRDLPLQHENGWFQQIIRRFRLSPSAASAQICSPPHEKNLCATARNIIRFAQALGIDDQHRQMLHVWKYLKEKHPYHVPWIHRPSKDTSLSEFMRRLYVAEQGNHFGTECYIRAASEDYEYDDISDDYHFDDNFEFGESDEDL